MKDFLNWQVIQSVLRNLAQWVGGTMVANGVFSDDQATLFTGAILSVAALVFSFISARFKKAAIVEAGGKEAVKDAIDLKSMGSN